ncbi:aminotransferase [Magnetospirillum sulfuroxidans]|uniref:Aminotransferase n=1 Tax=Magnetospirillum sulfuroxidans TaxID=611300 RepID=A0ABS5IEP6_9PROT|nr:aminotransferase [Magnetospirillum sulfuroxidans]MBR9972887.1 aminotransferase [Magnetospirillum sulfuroxidans]
MPRANSVFAACGTTIFETMSRLAQRHDAINLGQGFPEGLEPSAVIEQLARAAADGPHQYPSMMGLPALRHAVAAHECRFWGTGVSEAEVMVTSGATEALAACLFALIEPGDEVVVLEPLYDSYLPIIRRAGGVPRIVRLQAPNWSLPRQQLADAFGPKTKLMILNSPANPCGKVFDADELAFIAQLLERHDAIAICDEVYEHLTYDDLPHIPLMSLPGMRQRCAKIGSAGKIFSLTGWKVGWVVAAPELLNPIAKAHQYLTFTTAPALQSAVAWGLNHASAYIASLPATLSARRDRLAHGLAAIGLTPLPCQGSYFLSADFRPLGFSGTDLEFCVHITEKAGITAIPISAFFESAPPGDYARFCFAKTDQAIDEALRRLRRHFGG